MHIGILDLILIYSIPFLLMGIVLAVFLVVLYVIVKKDVGRIDFAQDVRHNIEIRKRPLTFSIFAQIMLFENGVQAAFLYRCARYLHLHGLNAVASFLHKFGKYLTNIDVPPTAKVGPGIVFLHGCNIVLTPYCETGRNVVFRPWSGMRGWGTVKVGDGGRVGLHSMVLDCATMGENAESAPCAVVFKQDVPANHIAFGVPVDRMVPMPETRLEGVTLELESVLLEPAQIMEEALRSALNRVGKEFPKSRRFKPEDWPPEKVICHQLRKEMALRQEALEEYVRSVRSGLGSGMRLRTHGKELVEKIRERGLKLSVISKQPDILAREIAERLDLTRSLDFICGADDFLSEWKPQPWIVYRPMRELKIMGERMIYVAGSLLDLQTGIEAAVKVYWVTPPGVPHQPRRGVVERFPDLETVLAEFSKPQLPQTF